MSNIDSGICAPKGFKASGIHAGIRKNKNKKDLALIVSECPAYAAAVYTTNLVKGAPLTVTEKHLRNGIAQAILCNSGNANTCNADGEDIANEMCALVERYAGIKADDVIIASTGVIGQSLDVSVIAAKMEDLAGGLSPSGEGAAEAIMTTDTKKKQVCASFTVGGKLCTIGGIAKGSGMIHPNMATLLVFLTTDAAISPDMLNAALKEDVADSFNMVSVDGDTSTNDMMSILANGMAENAEITSKDAGYRAFKKALHTVTSALCRMIAADGEGATKLVECRLSGAKNKKTARIAAKSIITSNLFKAAMFGADANWGRALCALGYSGAALDVTKIDLSFASVAGRVDVCKGGAGIPFSEEIAKDVLTQNEIYVLVELNDGKSSATAWGCDLTYDYVKINGDYRS
ncbi:MAG: bifunctional glutamate N-acetyltransferase/amino-acid acetyltransferase ArgJ [Clostridiaceae bacterium]|nr:bifunctional glutamate N-acetyltransferase/amino-acid acetyltransferase ArgJ [Clostridiaceae bacterium]